MRAADQLAEEVDTQIPTAPLNLTAASAGLNGVRLSWDAAADNSGVTGYRVYRRTLPFGSFTQVAGPDGENCAYADSGLGYNTAYQYYLTAVDAAGNESRAGNTVEVVTGAAPSEASSDGTFAPIPTPAPVPLIPGVIAYEELTIEAKERLIRASVLDETLQAHLDAGRQPITINLDQADNRVAMVFSKDQLGSMVANRTAIRLVTRYGYLIIPAEALPLEGELELSLGEYASAVALPEGAAKLGQAVEFTTNRELVQPAVLDLGIETGNLDPAEEVFLWALSQELRPLALNPENGRFQVEVTGSEAFVVTGFQGSFADIAEHWARRDILLLNLQGMVHGVDTARFEPDRAVSRAEFTALLLRLLGLEGRESAEGVFGDVTPDKWYFATVNTALGENLVAGYDGKFGPERPVSRQEAAALIMRALARVGAYEGMDLVKIDETLAVFADAGRIADWAREMVAAAVRAGIFRGKAGVIFDPEGQATRAEAAAVITRLLGS